MTEKTIDLVAVLQGSLTLADFAQRHGMTEHEAELAREHFLAGLATAAASRRRVTSTWFVVAALVGCGVFAARTAWAGSCATPGSFPSTLGLTYFCSDEPAYATDVNGNTERLVSLITQKVGALPSGDLSTGAVTAASATLSGGLTANVVSANSHTPRTGGTITNNGGLTVTGPLDVGAYQKTCSAGSCFCNAVGERALTWSTTCQNVGHSIYAAVFSVDAQQRSGFSLSCYHTNGNVYAATSVSIVCARLTVN